jgi:hypothetical protein
MRITLHEYRNNPQLRLNLELAARRERAKVLGRLFANILSRSKDGHAAGTHFARQG